MNGDNTPDVKWDFLKERLKAQLAVGVAPDLIYAQSKREELYTLMQSKHGIDREKTDQIISAL